MKSKGTKRKKPTLRHPAKECSFEGCNKKIMQRKNVCGEHTFEVGRVWILESYRNYMFWVPKWNNEKEIAQFKKRIDKYVEAHQND